MKSIIVAYDNNRGIGSDNQLLWQRDLPADLQHFKNLTTGQAIIMGRKTFDSIGRPLPQRQNIVVTRDHSLHIADVDVVHSLADAYDAVLPGRDVFVIGGAQIYTEAISGVTTIFATEVDAQFDNATVFFPPFDMTLWHESSRVHHERDERNAYVYDFVTYIRI